MLSNNLKRSVATLGVVAGLLAAAGPASALGVGVGENGSQGAVKAPTFMHGDFSSVVVKAPTNAGTQVGSEGVIGDVPTETVSFIKGAAFRGEVTGLEPV